MKSQFTQPKVGLFLFLLITLLALIIHSCKKDSSPSNSQNDTPDAAVAEAKTWYEGAFPPEPVDGNGLATNSVKSRKWAQGINPDWSKPSVYNQGKDKVIEMPLFNTTVSFAVNVIDGTKIDLKNNYARATYLLKKDSTGTFNAWLMVVIADTAYLSGDFTKLNNNTYRSRDKDFSGRLMYFTPTGDFLAGWRYDKGSITKSLSFIAGSTPGVSQVQAIKTNTYSYCVAYPVTTVTYQCITVNFNNSGNQTTCTPYYSTSYMLECSTGGGDGGGGGGGGGGGSTTFPPPPSNPPGCPVVANVINGKNINMLEGGGGNCPPVVPPPPPAEDPCLKARKAATQATNPLVSQHNAAVMAGAGSNERGYDLRLTSPNSTTYVNTPIRGGTTASFVPNFTWNSTDGYTIGSAHYHPGGSAPSPDDVFTMIDNLSSLAAASASVSDINFYKNNASITVLTTTGTYVVTVSNWGGLQQLFQTFNADRNAFDLNYQRIATQYKTANGSDEGTATVYGLKNIFGNAINVYKASNNSTDFAVVSIDNNGKVIVTICPQD